MKNSLFLGFGVLFWVYGAAIRISTRFLRSQWGLP